MRGRVPRWEPGWARRRKDRLDGPALLARRFGTGEVGHSTRCEIRTCRCQAGRVGFDSRGALRENAAPVEPASEGVRGKVGAEQGVGKRE